MREAYVEQISYPGQERALDELNFSLEVKGNRYVSVMRAIQFGEFHTLDLQRHLI
jgi:hypothetical protein